MSDTKFTKGEWVQSYGTLVKIGDAEWEFKSCADASLVASAPQMYAMLDAVLCEMHNLIDEVNDQRCAHRNPMSETPPDLHDSQTLHEIQLLLAKARGEA